MDNIFRDYSEKILIYLSVTSTDDPYEKQTTEDLLNSVPIRAIVSDYSFEKVRWSMPSISTDSVKEILVEYKHKSLIEQSYRISIDGENYQGYKINGKLSFRKEGSYMRVLCYSERT